MRHSTQVLRSSVLGFPLLVLLAVACGQSASSSGSNAVPAAAGSSNDTASASALQASTGVDWIVSDDATLKTVMFAAPKSGPASLPSGGSLSDSVLAFLDANKAALRLDDPRTDFTVVGTAAESTGTRVTLRQQTGGIEVHDFGWRVHLDAQGQLTSIDGMYAPSLVGFDVNATTTKQAALATSVADIHSRKPTLGAKALGASTATLEVWLDHGTPRLVWFTSTPVVDPAGTELALYFVDAKSGSILNYADGDKHAMATGQGGNFYPPYSRGDDLHSFPVSDDAVATMKGTQSGVVLVTTTSALAGAPIPNTGTLAAWTDTSLSPGNSVDAQAYGAKVIQFYHDVQMWNSWNGAGGQLTSTVQDTNVDDDNAMWWSHDNAMHYGKGTDVYLPAASSFDTVAHEITHGVTQSTSALSSTDPIANSVNEAMSDIWAAFMNHWIGRADSDAFRFCEECRIDGRPLRSMVDPLNPITSEGDRINHVSLVPEGGKYDEHDGSNIVGSAFYMMTAGGVNTTSHQGTVCGIGWASAQQLWWDLEKNRIHETTTWQNLALLSLQSAKDLHISLTPVGCAWRAVGAINDADLQSNWSVTCPAVPGEDAGTSTDAGSAATGGKGSSDSDAGVTLVTGAGTALVIACGGPLTGGSDGGGVVSGGGGLVGSVGDAGH